MSSGAEPGASVRPCTHCGMLVEVAPDASGANVYCCSGCELAWQIIHGAGLDRYYAERERPAPRPAAPGLGWDRVPLRPHPEGGAVADLTIDGLSCASCVWVTERVLESIAGVSNAHVSYATGRTRLHFEPEVVDLSAICARVSAIGYRPRPLDAEPQRDRTLLMRLGLASFAAVNVMMLMVPIYLGWWQGMAPHHAALLRLAALALSTPVVLWAALPFYRTAWAGLRQGVPHVDLPVSVAVLGLYLHGLVATATGVDHYLDSLTMLVALLLAGRVLEQGRRRRALDAATAIAGAVPRVVRRAGRDGPEEVPVEALVVGDCVHVASGEEIGADGEVVEGRALVAMALLTGESAPVELGPGDRVVAGGVLHGGALVVRVEAVAEESLVARMAGELLEAAQRPLEPTVADRLAPWFTVGTLVLAAAALLGHGLSRGFQAGWPAAVAVLVVACPCALALSAPLARAAGLGAAARRGLLVRSGDVLARLAEVDLVALDKTGTLTRGRPELVEASADTLRLAAGVERHSAHPVGRAIVDAAVARGIAVPQGRFLAEVPGGGVRGEVDGRALRVAPAGPGRVGVWQEEGEELLGVLVMSDVVRQDARRALRGLERLGLSTALLTGDHPEVARRIAEQVGIAEVQAGLQPQDKAAWVRQRQAEGRRVLFVGDGHNDGPALAAADVGVAMSEGASSSVLVADAVISTAAVGPILAGVQAARAAEGALRANLSWSLGYNAVAVVLALFGWVNPLVAAVLMPLSSALVVARSSAVESRVTKLLDEASTRAVDGHQGPG